MVTPSNLVIADSSYPRCSLGPFKNIRFNYFYKFQVFVEILLMDKIPSSGS